MNYFEILSLLKWISFGFALGVWFSNWRWSSYRDSNRLTMYGIPLYEYNELSYSKQHRLQFEYYLDNNNEYIGFIDELMKKLDNNSIKTLKEAKSLEKDLLRIHTKVGTMFELYSHCRSGSLLRDKIEELTPKDKEDLTTK